MKIMKECKFLLFWYLLLSAESEEGWMPAKSIVVQEQAKQVMQVVMCTDSTIPVTNLEEGHIKISGPLFFFIFHLMF